MEREWSWSTTLFAGPTRLLAQHVPRQTQAQREANWYCESVIPAPPRILFPTPQYLARPTPAMAATRLCHRKVFPSGLQQKISPTVGKVVSMEMAANLRWVQSSTRGTLPSLRDYPAAEFMYFFSIFEVIVVDLESSRQVVDGARWHLWAVTPSSCLPFSTSKLEPKWCVINQFDLLSKINQELPIDRVMQASSRVFELWIRSCGS